MVSVMNDERARTADRLEAAKWLADRGFGKAVQALDIDVNQYPVLDLTGVSTEDLDAMLAILTRYLPDAAELAESGRFGWVRGHMGRPRAGTPRHVWRGSRESAVALRPLGGNALVRFSVRFSCPLLSSRGTWPG
jgi:hypothetical protein